jgi:hypothetical protein
MDSVPGINRAAPMPCTPRAAISSRLLEASPHASDDTVKMASPARNIRFRPYRSPRMPPVSSNEANAST